MNGPAITFDGQPTSVLFAEMEANLVAHVAHLPALVPSASVIAGPDLVLVDAGVPSDTFNVVCGARLEPAVADARIATAIDHFRVRDAPFTWRVGPDSRPADLGARLVAHGLAAAGAEVAMAFDLARLPAVMVPPTGLVARRATSPAELADYARVMAAN